MLNQKGYALIIVSFFATILGLTGNIFMMNSQLDRDRKVTEHFEELTEGYRNQVKALLSSYRQCTYNLEDQMIGQDLQTLPGQASPSLHFSDNTLEERVIWPSQEIETKHGLVRIDSIRVLNIENEVGVLQDHLVAAVNLNPDGSVGFKSLNQRMIKIPLKTENPSGNQIVSCIYDGDDFTENLLRSKCENEGGTFDPPFTCDLAPPPFMGPGSFKTCGFNPIQIKQVAGQLEIVCGS